MSVMELGMIMETRHVHSVKAPSPILVTELGMVTDVRLLQAWYLLLVDYQYYTF